MNKAKRQTNVEAMASATYQEDALAEMGLPEASLRYEGEIGAVVLHARSKAHTLLHRLDPKDLPEDDKELVAQVGHIVTQLVEKAKELPDIPPEHRAREVAPGLIELPVSWQ